MPCHAVPAAIISPLEKNLSTYLSIYPLIHPSIQQDRLIDSWRTIRGMVYLLVYHHLQPLHTLYAQPDIHICAIHPSNIAVVVLLSSPDCLNTRQPPLALHHHVRATETERPRDLNISRYSDIEVIVA